MTTMQNKNTSPRPWKIGDEPNSNGGKYGIEADRGYVVADVYDDVEHLKDKARGNAELIVRAVNNHERLVEALERLTRVASVELESKRPDVLDQARQALKSARE